MSNHNKKIKDAEYWEVDNTSKAPVKGFVEEAENLEYPRKEVIYGSPGDMEQLQEDYNHYVHTLEELLDNEITQQAEKERSTVHWRTKAVEIVEDNVPVDFSGTPVNEPDPKAAPNPGISTDYFTINLNEPRRPESPGDILEKEAKKRVAEAYERLVGKPKAPTEKKKPTKSSGLKSAEIPRATFNLNTSGRFTNPSRTVRKNTVSEEQQAAIVVSLKARIPKALEDERSYQDFLAHCGVSHYGMPRFYNVESIEFNEKNELIISEIGREVSDKEPDTI